MPVRIDCLVLAESILDSGNLFLFVADLVFGGVRTFSFMDPGGHVFLELVIEFYLLGICNDAAVGGLVRADGALTHPWRMIAIARTVDLSRLDLELVKC